MSKNKYTEGNERQARGSKRAKLLSVVGACLSVTLLSSSALAEGCVSSPDCKTMGYTKSSCSDGGVKCPWGNYWFCGGKSCTDLGFNNTCTGTGYAGGASAACDGKYYECSCATGYAWDASSRSCKPYTGLQDGLYYCNGVVKGVQVGSESLVVALNDLGSLTWSNASSSCSTYSFCGNTKGVLPTEEQLKTIYKNISTVQSRLSANGGTQFTSTYYWSSSYGGYSSQRDFYWIVNPVSGNRDYCYTNDNGRYVRPVLAL